MGNGLDTAFDDWRERTLNQPIIGMGERHLNCIRSITQPCLKSFRTLAQKETIATLS